MYRYVLTVLLVCSGGADYAAAQTCSCAKAPVGSSLERPTTEAGVWLLSMTYEYHPIADIYVGTDKLKNDTRTRTSHTALFDISVGLTRRLSISTQMTFTQQERESTALLGSGESLRTRGVGDGLLLLKYNVIVPSGGSRLQAAIGGGIKVPVGTSSLANNGTLISADMQPGSGSWDGLIWTYLNQGLDDQYEVAVGSSSDNFAVVFRRATESAPDSMLTFEAVQGQLPIVMVDSDSSHYDWFGTAVDGPRAGQQLIATDSYISMWFAWATFHQRPWIQGQ